MASTTEPRSVPTSEPPVPAPILTLSKTIIRPYQPSDAPSSAKEANNPLIAQYMRNAFPNPYTLADAEGWIRIATSSPQALRHFAICKAPDGTFVGGIGLKVLGDVDCRTMELGYWIGQDHWGQGLVSDAVVGFTRWAFAEIPDLLRLEASVFEGNVASERVLLKTGFTFEGVRRKAIFKNGKSLDQRMFGLLREECPGLQEKARE